MVKSQKAEREEFYMMKRFVKAFVVFEVILYIAIQAVEISYPGIDFKEVEIKTEEMRVLGIDTMRTESGLVIKKGPGGNYRIGDPKTKILNGLNGIFFLSPIYVSTVIVTIVIIKRKEKKRDAL